MNTGMRNATDNDWREREKRAEASRNNRPVKSIEYSRAASGEHVLTHHFDNSGPGEMVPAKQHRFSNDQEMLAHFATHTGVKATKGSMTEGTDEA